MKAWKLCCFMMVCFMAVDSVLAASWIAYPGGDPLQQVIDDAAAGDNIAIMQGTYIEDITITKGLDIRGEAGKAATVQIHGTLTIQNVTEPVYLKGFRTGVSANGSIAINVCADVRIDEVTCDGNLSAAGGKVYVYKSIVTGRVDYVSGCDWTHQRTTSGPLASYSETKLIASIVHGGMSHHTVGSDCTVFQSTIDEKLEVTANNYWIAYNTVRQLDLRNGTGICEVVGNNIDGRDINLRLNTALPDERAAVFIRDTSPNFRNNCIVGWRFAHAASTGGSLSVNDHCNGIWVEGASSSPRLINNRINVVVDVSQANYGFNYNATRTCNGIYVQSGSPVIMGNDSDVSLSVDGSKTLAGYSVVGDASVTVNYNDLPDGVVGGCISRNTTTYPINTGPPEPFYEDHDRTRNDIGVAGGHAYVVGGASATAPVIIWAEATPLYVKRGGTVTLRARAAVRAQ